jgi:F-type H+-transporting ATPase subunit b
MSNLAAETAQNPLLPSWPEFIIGTIVFIIVFGILGKMLLPRILKTLAEREDQIEGGLNRADEAQAEAAAVLQQYRAQLEDAKHEASRLRSEAQEQGAQIIAEMREHAASEAARITETAHKQIEAERQQAVVSLRSDVGRISTDLASRIVGESLHEETRQKGIVERFLAELESGDVVREKVGGAAGSQGGDA